MFVAVSSYCAEPAFSTLTYPLTGYSTGYVATSTLTPSPTLNNVKKISRTKGAARVIRVYAHVK